MIVPKPKVKNQYIGPDLSKMRVVMHDLDEPITPPIERDVIKATTRNFAISLLTFIDKFDESISDGQVLDAVHCRLTEIATGE